MDDNKKSTTIWLRPSVISRMDGWLEADNCQSRSEFVDKALRFYMGYLGTENNTTYILSLIHISEKRHSHGVLLPRERYLLNFVPEQFLYRGRIAVAFEHHRFPEG